MRTTSLVFMLLFCGCLPQKQRVVPCKEQIVFPATTSDIHVSLPIDDLAGIQKYIGDGNKVTFSSATELQFGSTRLSAPEGTNITYTNQGDSVVLVFGNPLPIVSVKQWGVRFHPKLEKLTIEPDGSVSATVSELGRRIVKEGIFKWSAEKESCAFAFPPTKSTSSHSPVLIPFSNTHWVETHSGSTSAKHLVSEHGCPQWVADMYANSPDLLTQIHSGYHERSRGGSYRMMLVTSPKKASTVSPKASIPYCPTGNCPRY